jgi:hypothetical protein
VLWFQRASSVAASASSLTAAVIAASVLATLRPRLTVQYWEGEEWSAREAAFECGKNRCDRLSRVGNSLTCAGVGE